MEVPMGMMNSAGTDMVRNLKDYFRRGIVNREKNSRLATQGIVTMWIVKHILHKCGNIGRKSEGLQPRI